MSTAPTRQRFFVYAPDKTDEGILQLRLSVREKHLVGVKAAIADGTIRVGGFFTTPESIATPTTEKKVIGSTFICEADSIDEVKSLVERDEYYKAGVWDANKIVIVPFFAATPIP